MERLRRATTEQTAPVSSSSRQPHHPEAFHVADDPSTTATTAATGKSHVVTFVLGLVLITVNYCAQDVS